MEFDLSPLEEQFCEAVIKLRSPARAYHFVAGGPDVPYRTCEARGTRLMRQPAIRHRIRELREEQGLLKYRAEKITIPEVLRQFLLIANADPNELISLRIGCCRYCHGEGFRKQWTANEYLDAVAEWERIAPTMTTPPAMPDPAGGLDFDRTREPHPDCPECGGEGRPRVVLGDTMQLSEAGALLFQGVKETKDGLEVKLADRGKALDSVARILGAYKDTVSLDAKLSGALAQVHQAVTNPEDAQRAYLAMIAGDS